MDIDARDIVKITDNIKENYDRSISDAQKINLDEILVKYYDWWRCRQFLRNILYFETTPQLYSYLIGYATYGGARIISVSLHEISITDYK